jgi:hypothetical protein
MDTSLFDSAVERLTAYYQDLVHKVFSLLRHRNQLPAWVNRDPARIASITLSSMCKAIVYSDTMDTLGIHERRFIDIMKAELCEYRTELVERFGIDCVCALRDILNGKVGANDDD